MSTYPNFVLFHLTPPSVSESEKNKEIDVDYIIYNVKIVRSAVRIQFPIRAAGFRCQSLRGKVDVQVKHVKLVGDTK